MNNPECSNLQFFDDRIELLDTLVFRHSSYAGTMCIYASNIQYYALSVPKNIIILSNDLLFVDLECRENLIQFCINNNIAQQHYYDIWEELSHLLEYDFISPENFKIMQQLQKMGYSTEVVFAMIKKYKWHLSQTDAYGEMGVYQFFNSFFFSKQKYAELVSISLEAFNTSLAYDGDLY